MGEDFVKEIKEMKKEGKLSEFEYYQLLSMDELYEKVNSGFMDINNHLEKIEKIIAYTIDTEN